jgi:hypothetical protein
MRRHDTRSRPYFVVEELPLDERLGEVRGGFFGRTFPELCFPRGGFLDLLPARPFGVVCFWFH